MNQTTKFQPGQSGNPAGRPKGSKHKLQESFLRDFVAAWEESGITAIKNMIANDPGKFVQIAASLMPKDIQGEIEHRVRDARWLTPKELLLSSTAPGQPFSPSTKEKSDGLLSSPIDEPGKPSPASMN